MKTQTRSAKANRFPLALAISVIMATAAPAADKPGTEAGPKSVPAAETAWRAAQPPIIGKVLETTNAATYTYFLVQHGGAKTWVAASEFKVAVGDEVEVPDGWVMKDFRSPTLNRVFDWILFTSAVGVAGKTTNAATGRLPSNHPPLAAEHVPPKSKSETPPLEVRRGSVTKISGGRTVEECFAQQKKLEGKSVKVRGVVVKFNSSILGRNWIHLRDGTGDGGANDLVVTTKETVKVGDLVVVEGKLSCERDFGSGYKYALLLEDAVLSLETTVPTK